MFKPSLSGPNILGVVARARLRRPRILWPVARRGGLAVERALCNDTLAEADPAA